jgi:hypothetical protein
VLKWVGSLRVRTPDPIRDPDWSWWCARTEREAARLERLATNVWEGVQDDIRLGYSIDQQTQLDVFNFANGTRYLSRTVESRRSSAKELSEIVELLLLQSQTVDHSLRRGKIGRSISRDWDETKASLDFLARRLAPGREPVVGRKESPAAGENLNNIKVEIKEVRHAGNLFGTDYRIYGVISGRNIASAGVYHGGRLLKAISVPLHDRRFNENSFKVRIEAPGDQVTIRVIDERGFVLEHSVEIPSGGLLPGLR